MTVRKKYAVYSDPQFMWAHEHWFGAFGECFITLDYVAGIEINSKYREQHKLPIRTYPDSAAQDRMTWFDTEDQAREHSGKLRRLLVMK